MNEYIIPVADADVSPSERWELYRVLSEPARLRLLALAAEDELSIGELAELLGENQPNVSRHAAALRHAGLLRDRREGTRTLVHVPAEASRDAVIADALASGKALCEHEGRLARIGDVLRQRDAATREFFARPLKERVDGLPAEMGAYLAALAPLVPRRNIAVDAGTGDGRLLEVLAPIYAHVVAIDRSDAQLASARQRAQGRGFDNVTFVCGELDERELRRTLGWGRDGGARVAGADAVFASRVLHHAPQPAKVVTQLAALCAPGGSLVVIDYARHDDESMRDQADAWLGFEPAELRRLARFAGLDDARVTRIPPGLCGDGPDGHLPWQVLVAKKPANVKGKRENG